MAEPGTKIISETTREIDGITVTETTIQWNETPDVSVSYEADGVSMHADEAALTSFDESLTGSELRSLLSRYGFPVFDGEQ